MIYNIYIFILGSALASFLNALMYRIEAGFKWKEMLFTRSRCESCSRDLNWYELIPIFSWIFQKGKCTKCKKKLDYYHPISELFLGIGFVLVFNYYPQYYWFLLFLVVLFMLSYSDFHTKSIPQTLTHIALILGLIFFILNYKDFRLISLGYFILIAIFIYILNWIKKSFGLGDVLLFLFFAFIFSPAQYISFLLITIYTAAIFSIFLVVKDKKNFKSYIPFVPFMTISFVLTPLFNLTWIWFLN